MCKIADKIREKHQRAIDKAAEYYNAECNLRYRKTVLPWLKKSFNANKDIKCLLQSPPYAEQLKTAEKFKLTTDEAGKLRAETYYRLVVADGFNAEIQNDGVLVTLYPME